jgi:hypothetical protein
VQTTALDDNEQSARKRLVHPESVGWWVFRLLTRRSLGRATRWGRPRVRPSQRDSPASFKSARVTRVRTITPTASSEGWLYLCYRPAGGTFGPARAVKPNRRRRTCVTGLTGASAGASRVRSTAPDRSHRRKPLLVRTPSNSIDRAAGLLPGPHRDSDEGGSVRLPQVGSKKRRPISGTSWCGTQASSWARLGS